MERRMFKEKCNSRKNLEGEISLHFLHTCIASERLFRGNQEERTQHKRIKKLKKRDLGYPKKYLRREKGRREGNPRMWRWETP
mmetsp:Transcript_60318/g.68752  ORF Transcript_60318/g.68752 Transcript_60318/m.68752 type:complete len:83 (+) Transcript_60318:1224-1472(+)